MLGEQFGDFEDIFQFPTFHLIDETMVKTGPQFVEAGGRTLRLKMQYFYNGTNDTACVILYVSLVERPFRFNPTMMVESAEASILAKNSDEENLSSPFIAEPWTTQRFNNYTLVFNSTRIACGANLITNLDAYTVTSNVGTAVCQIRIRGRVRYNMWGRRCQIM